jgi:hypothetical protein
MAGAVHVGRHGTVRRGLTAALTVLLALGGLPVIRFSPAWADATISGAITPGDPTQARRLLRNGTESTCGAAKANPGLIGRDNLRYDSYRFVATPGTCVTVTITLTSETGDLFVAAYAPDFDPNDPSRNYLADPGFSVRPESSLSRTFSFVAPASDFVLVVHEVGAGDGGSYTLEVRGASTCTITGAGDIAGTPGDDVICGSEGPDRIAGLDGNDVILGLGGDDQLSGGQGDDRLFGGREGVDRLSGGPGDDYLNTADGSGGDYAVGGEHAAGDTCDVDSGDFAYQCER